MIRAIIFTEATHEKWRLVTESSKPYFSLTRALQEFSKDLERQMEDMTGILSLREEGLYADRDEDGRDDGSRKRKRSKEVCCRRSYHGEMMCDLAKRADSMEQTWDVYALWCHRVDGSGTENDCNCEAVSWPDRWKVTDWLPSLHVYTEPKGSVPEWWTGPKRLLRMGTKQDAVTTDWFLGKEATR